MKGVKGKFLKKLKSIKPVGVLKQARVLHINAFNGFLDPSSSSSSPLNTNSVILQDSSNYRNQEDHRSVQVKNLDVDIAELIKDLEDEEMEFGEGENKENIGPLLKKLKDPFLVPDDKEKFKNPTLSESENDLSCAPSSFHRVDSTSLKDNSEKVGVDVSSFRRPDLSAGSLFDPNLLAAFDKARMEHIRLLEALREARIEEKKVEEVEEEEEGPPLKARRLDEDPLLEFEEKCPPGGSELVILYTTSLRGIRKTFEDCQSIRFLLDSFKILFHERDVSMHLEYREEMWRILDSRVVPPRLFIKGRYIGGADTVVTLHEQGKLLQLLEGLPRDQSTSPCDGCGGMRFILCYNCNGSRKISPDGSDDGLSVQCPQCNENGLLVCPMCC